MRVVIVGAGGVGGYLGVRLHQAGHEVAYLVRARTLEALQTRGIVLRNSLGDAHIPQVRASDDAAALGPADAVIVTVKLYDLPALAPRLAPLAGPETMILPLQNGIRLLGLTLSALSSAEEEEEADLRQPELPFS